MSPTRTKAGPYIFYKGRLMLSHLQNSLRRRTNTLPLSHRAEDTGTRGNNIKTIFKLTPPQPLQNNKTDIPPPSKLWRLQGTEEMHHGGWITGLMGHRPRDGLLAGFGLPLGAGDAV